MTQITMTQISRQCRHASFGISAGPIAVKHRLYGCPMPEIMQPRSAPIRGATQSNLPRQAHEGLPSIAMEHASGAAGYKEWFDVAPMEVVIASLQI